MHAVLVSVEILDMERARQGLREDLVPAVSRASGFVAGHWVHAGDDRGQAVIVMESEEAAEAVAGRVRDQAPDSPVRLLDVRVGEVVAHA